jgi:hypothetical protein
MPNPASFPRRDWYDEVRRGFDFYFQSGRSDLSVPSQAEVTAWFQSQAPEELASPMEVASDEAGTFAQVPVAQALISTNENPAAAVSFIDVIPADGGSASSTGSGQAAPPHLLISDMQNGVVRRMTTDGVLLTEWTCADNPAAVRIVDIDGDGTRDVVIADLGSFLPADHKRGKVIWIPGGLDDVTAQPVTILESVGRIADVQAGDFDLDGDADLVVAEFGWHTTGGIHVLFNEEPSATAAADDAGTDLLPAPRRFRTVLLDQRPGTIHVPIVDLNGDSRPDIVALISQEHEVVEAFLNLPEGFQKVTLHASPDPSFGSSGIQLVDFDGDTDTDIVLSNGDTFDSYLIKPYHGIQLLRNNGEAKFTLERIADMPGVHRALAADMDGDGDQDIVAAALLPSRTLQRLNVSELQAVIWLEQQPAGSFIRHVVHHGRPEFAALLVSDVSLDGQPDIVAPCFHDHPVAGEPLLRMFLNRTRP